MCVTISIEPVLVVEVSPFSGGLLAMPQKLRDKILADEYVDFTKFPPAKGKGRSGPFLSPPRFGHLVAMFFHLRGSGGIQSSRMDPQADGITRITKDSITFKWSSWVIYDQNFRQEVVNYPGQSWARVNSGILVLRISWPAQKIGVLTVTV